MWNAQIELLDGGHFLLESEIDEVTRLVRWFLDPLRSKGADAAAGAVGKFGLPSPRDWLLCSRIRAASSGGAP